MAGVRRGSAVGGLSVEAAHYYARIYAPARAGCIAALRRAGCGEADAEDIFAATLERIMRKFDDPESSPYAPAQTVALLKKACLQKLIDERRHRDVLDFVPLEDAGARAGEGTGPAEAAEGREAVAIAREAIASLSDRDRALFYQRHLLELTPQEIIRRNPGLSERTYRKVIWRANARALRAFEEIEEGERCAQMGGERLRRFAAGEGDEVETAAVKRHLRRCGACRAEAARMRTHLHDVAAGLAAVLAIEFEQGGLAAHVLGAWDGALGHAHAAGAGLRAARERLRELVLKVATALPGSGGEASAGQLAGISALKATSVCAAGALAVGCIAAGALQSVDSGAPGGRHGAHARPVRHESPSSSIPPAAETSDSARSSAGKKPASADTGGEVSAHAGVKTRHAPSGGFSRSSTPAAESTLPVESEFGSESTGTPVPSGSERLADGSKGSTAGTEISRSRAAGEKTGSGSSSSSSEFGF